MKWGRIRRDRALDDFADAIRPELTDMPTLHADDALWRRIVATRASGVRGILPDVTPRRRRRRRFGAFVSVAAAAIVVSVLIPRIERGPRRPIGANGDRFPAADYGVFQGLALAQELASDGPLVLPVRLTKTAELRPLNLQFARRLRDSTGRVTSDTRGELAMIPTELRGARAWRVVARDIDATSSQLRVADETLYVARYDLRLLERVVHVKPYLHYDRINIAQRFAGDSVTGRMTTEGGDSRGVGRPIARRLAPEFGPYIPDAFAPVFLAGVRLSRDWSGSVSLLGWAVRSNDVFVPLELRVDGEEVVQTPAGRFDCWRLSVRYAGKQIWYWARKSDGVGVRVLDETRRNSVGTREVLLVRDSFTRLQDTSP